MSSYTYRAIAPSGTRESGVVESSSPALATRTLEERGWLVLAVDQQPAAMSSARPRATSRRRDLLEATRSIATLLDAGLPLAQALAAAQQGAAPSSAIAAALADVRQSVERGDRLSSALSAHAPVFPPIYIGLVRSGERSGALAPVFARLAEQIEREEVLRARVVSASIYPLILALAGLASMCVLMFVVLPRFADLLAGSGAQLPSSTHRLLTVATTLREHWVAFVGLAVMVSAGAAAAAHTADGRRVISGALLQLPVVGPLRRETLGARFARLTGVLLSHGVPLLTALDDTAASMADVQGRAEVERLRGRIREGASITQALEEGTLFPVLLTQLVGVGERAGRLPVFLLKAADLFDDRVERTRQRLVALMEPGMVVAFGAGIGVVAVSLLQAVYGVNAGAFR